MSTTSTSTTTSTARSDLAGALSIGAGLVHAAAAGTHSGTTTAVWLFTASALVQVGAGALLLVSPSRRALAATALVNVVCAGAWLASRTTGIGIVADLAHREAVGTQDLLCALLGVGAAGFALWALRPVSAPTGHRLTWLPALALLPAVIGVAAPHQHDEGAAHEHGAEATETHSHDEVTATPEAEGHAHAAPAPEGDGLAAASELSGADTSGASEDQLTAAIDLVDTTRAAVAGRFTDTASAEAAGYVWIGDGRRVGRYQHYINPAYLSDGRVLDPDHIESIVFESTAAGPVLVSTMYVLETGTTMAEVPDVAGELTTWHDHQNLCWDDSGTRLAGVAVDGTCRPAGTLRPTPPMLHVWLDGNACGPFAGIEGHGATDAACAPHEH